MWRHEPRNVHHDITHGIGHLLDARAGALGVQSEAAKEGGPDTGKEPLMITRSNTRIGGRHAGKLTTLVAGVAALSLATLGFASSAGATTGSSTYLAGYELVPGGGLASASVTFTVPTV